MSGRAGDTGASGTAGDAGSRQLAPDAAVAVRLALADDADGDSIRRLASLAGSAPPDGPVLLAEADGEPVAALGLADGRAVAHPSRSHPAILTHLHLRRLEARLIGAIWAC
jgi:hypothetical protein